MLWRVLLGICGVMIILTGTTRYPQLWETPKTRFYRRLLGDGGARLFLIIIGGALIFTCFRGF